LSLVVGSRAYYNSAGAFVIFVYGRMMICY
jgi:hypothetical protein